MPRITTPVTVITGFLGAGKTTLVNRILREVHGQRLAVIENEFGAVGVDAEFLVIEKNETVIQLDNGCLCCTVRGDLARALNDLARQADAGAFSFDRVLIETTGLADPGPIIQTFLAETAILTRFHLDGVVTLVDAFHGLAALERIEHRAQIGYADRLLLTKSDLTGPEARQALDQRLAAMNPPARRLPVDLHHDDLAEVLALLFDARGYTFDYVPPDELARLRAARLDLAIPSPDGRLRPMGTAVHSEDVVSCVFESEAPLDLARLNQVLDAAVQRFGPRLWRCKGVVFGAQQRQRLVVQGVQSMIQIHGGTIWRPREPRRTVLVFIGQALDVGWILAALQMCEAGEAAGARAGPGSS
jgi:G3E family GTPase